jgi:hypothetical protein
MKFHPSSTDPTSQALLVCRNTRWFILVLLAIIWAAPIFWWSVSAPLWVTILCAALPLFLTWPMLSSWRKRGGSHNWVLALYGDGLWLNLRDCEYAEAAVADSIVFLPYGEISAARRVVHRYTTPNSDHGSTSHKDVFLELEMSAENVAELRRALTDERFRNPPERSHLGGAVTSRTRRSQFPVEVEGDNAVRIKFAVFSYRLRPSIGKVLAALQQYVVVEPERRQTTANWRELDDAQFDALLRRLVVAGQRMDATALMRERTKISLTDAHLIIKQLEGDPRLNPLELAASAAAEG